MVLVKLRVSAGEAKSGPPLAPILGQHQVNLMEFCKAFNSNSLDYYSPGVPLRVVLIKNAGQPVRQIIKSVTLYALLKNVIIYTNKGRLEISVDQAYDIFRFRCYEFESVKSRQLSFSDRRALASELFGFMTSYGRLVKV